MEMKNKKKSARTIQCTYRMHRQRMEYKLAIAAIITIQKCWRRKKVYIKMHKVLELKKQMLALMFNWWSYSRFNEKINPIDLFFYSETEKITYRNEPEITYRIELEWASIYI